MRKRGRKGEEKLGAIEGRRSERGRENWERDGRDGGRGKKGKLHSLLVNDYVMKGTKEQTLSTFSARS